MNTTGTLSLVAIKEYKVMVKKVKQLQHSATIRLPTELHDWVIEVSKEFKTTPSYIYRQAIWHFKDNFISAK